MKRRKTLQITVLSSKVRTSFFWVSLFTLAVVAMGSPRTCVATTVVYDTTPYWATVSAVIGGMGPGQSSTIGETFVAPAGPNVTLNDFSFFAESYYPYNGGVASLHLRAFVYAWASTVNGPPGAGATGSPLYLSPSFVFSPPPRPGGWVPLTASIGGNGLTLIPGQRYVMGFTLSDPADYAASQGDIEFKMVVVHGLYYSPPPVPVGVDIGSGSLTWLNNGNNFAALTTPTWTVADSWEQTDAMSFTAHFTVVPEPSAVALALLGATCGMSRCVGAKRRQRQ
jgi:hypothetical protein